MINKILTYSFITTFIIVFVGNLYLNLEYKNKILPNTYINGINVGGLTED